MSGEDTESEEALGLYGRAPVEAVEPVPVVEPSSGAVSESVGDSRDEETVTADSYNSRRRENERLRKLKAKNARREQENMLRMKVAVRIVNFVAGQLVLANALIWVYFLVMLARGDQIPSEVIIAWLSSTIVEVLGLLWVIARSLFPFHDRHRDRDGEKAKR
ncbi:hypothetical protein [Bifidobacterium oedipodis]|uniref:2TM domain-containing protein n=1 Tax=Bifidobacterium oedipodis TaxID=2675322 RepID=A0A7Y0EPC1_9BIFI|nr:hypothetical protein [Bifidobacterium sp. DSM 109957]NMM93951.1 hypothetical protein [Bifidobacterium sp. DSM 109957]